MRLSPTLSAYFGRHFLLAVGGVFLVLVVLAFSFDAVELLRRASGRPEVGVFLVLEMALFKLPSLSQKLLPFACLFGAMAALTRLTRTNELVAARAAGVSVWQFLAPAVLLALAIGLFAITVYNPLAATLISRYEQLDAKFMRGRASLLAVSGSGLWLREADAEGQTVIHALRVAQQGVELNDAIMFFYEGRDRFEQRIDASTARLRDGYWELENALITGPNRAAEFHEHYRVPTTLTFDQIQDSFASPETMSFWALPGFIQTLENAGFSGLRHRLHWYSILSQPFLLAAMVLIAATFSLRFTRRGGTTLLLGGGVFAGFLLYFLSDLGVALGLSGSIPVILAAWAPAGISLLLGLAMLMHLEDG